MTNYTDKDIEKLKQALVAPLKEELDRDWEDETPEQIITIARNGIYWRTIANKNATQQATAVAIEAAARAVEHVCISLPQDAWKMSELAGTIRALKAAPSGTANVEQPQSQLSSESLSYNNGLYDGRKQVEREHEEGTANVEQLRVAELESVHVMVTVKRFPGEVPGSFQVDLPLNGTIVKVIDGVHMQIAPTGRGR